MNTYILLARYTQNGRINLQVRFEVQSISQDQALRKAANLWHGAEIKIIEEECSYGT